ncbi:hypothetical protein PCA10_19810 [Metapseudomonas resinovorans NBRC 106553]|uniref:Oligosaccharide repeat unit polymerase n=1 Tax=Metapseudomonas resinovorans NBRC 106553 TaxID=1245471 RepID=S6APT0_METRE|nr:hypothetical protein PCA10_19810 [Pseudomonas resinovorans NBRC 106553]
MFISLVILLIYCLSSIYVDENSGVAYFFVFLSVLVVSILIVVRGGLSVFEPITWFYLMSSLFYVFAGIICFYGFDFLYHDNFSNRPDRYSLLFDAIFVFTIGVIGYWVGDYFAGLYRYAEAKGEVTCVFSNRSLLFLGGVSIAVGIFNYILNAYMYGGGDLLLLLKDFGARDHRAEDVSFYSTFGYNFIVVGLFFLMLRRVAYFGSIGVLYKIIFVLGLCILLSTGRIWYSISLFFVFLALAHFSGLTVSYKRLAKYSVLFLLFIISVYFLRYYSNLLYIGKEGSFDAEIGNDFLTGFLVFIFGRSNVPSVPILMEVVHYYSETQDFYLGKTFFYWLSYFVPGYDVIFLGHEIKENFYPGRPGGFPPTFFGELFANGGIPFVVVFSIVAGFIFRTFYLYARGRGSFLVYFVYSSILFRFIFMLPKLELSAFGSAVWLFLPTFVVCSLIYLVYRVGRPGMAKK